MTVRAKTVTTAGSKGGIGGLLAYVYFYCSLVVDWDIAQIITAEHLEAFVTGSFAAFAGVGTIAGWNRDQPSAGKATIDISAKPVKSWFSEAELDCKCSDEIGCNYQGMHSTVMSMANDLRETFGTMIVTSAYRCPEHNKKVGGSSDSYHVKSMAIDMRSPTVPPRQLYDYLDAKYPQTFGLGLYKTFIHMDCRTGKWARKTGPDNQWQQFEHETADLLVS